MCIAALSPPQPHGCTRTSVVRPELDLNDGICNAEQVLGEYGLTNVLMSHGYNIATLMARYRPVRPCEFSKYISQCYSCSCTMERRGCNFAVAACGDALRGHGWPACLHVYRRLATIQARPSPHTDVHLSAKPCPLADTRCTFRRRGWTGGTTSTGPATTTCTPADTARTTASRCTRSRRCS